MRIFPLLIFLFTLISCTEKAPNEAENLLNEIRADYEAGRYQKALQGVDSLRHAYPMAVNERKEALKIHQEASLKMAQDNLAQVDQALQAAEKSYDSLAIVVEVNRKALTATPQMLQQFNELRVLRDSLRTVFTVECAKIKYIHKRQEQVK